MIPNELFGTTMDGNDNYRGVDEEHGIGPGTGKARAR